MEGFSCEAFQNTAGARIEAERPQRKIFGELWPIGKLAEDPLFIFVQRRSSFLAQF